MTVKIILFNGPPRSGKDTAAAAVTDWLLKKNAPVIHRKFAQPLKEATHILLGLNQQADSFEDKKDKLCDEFYGFKPRDVYIRLSEKFLKPLFGQEVFANTFCRSIKNWIIDNGPSVVVVSDCGFDSEAKTAAEFFGHNNVLIIQINRPECNFDNDSRMYVDGNYFGCRTIIVNNITEKEDFIKQVILEVDNWLPNNWTDPEEQTE